MRIAILMLLMAGACKPVQVPTSSPPGTPGGSDGGWTVAVCVRDLGTSRMYCIGH